MYRTLIVTGAIVSLGVSVYLYYRGLTASLDHRYHDGIYYAVMFAVWWFIVGIGMITMAVEDD